MKSLTTDRFVEHVTQATRQGAPRVVGRPAFTLVELLAVLVILAVLAALVVPRISGMSGEANTATNANILSAVNRAVQQYEAQQGELPTTWDYVVDENDQPYRLHPEVQPLVQVHSLTTEQAQSLQDAGINGGHIQDSTFTGFPHESIADWLPIDEGRSVLTLVKPATFGGHYEDFPDRAFGINQFNAEGFASEYVVMGLAGPTSLRGTTIHESPIVQAADPQENYARVLAVFRVPGVGQQTFTAQYVGCFGPDGTSINDNINKYNQNRAPAN